MTSERAGFLMINDKLTFVPLNKNTSIYEFQGKAYELNKIDKKIFLKIEETINDEKDISEFGMFEEDPENECIQSWIVNFVYQEDLLNEILKIHKIETELKSEIEDVFERIYSEVGGGFRPSILLDYEEDNE